MLSYITNTLTRLLQEPRILPIINENDTVAIRELNFGDNDMLCVRLAKLIGAKRVILLTSVDGLIDPETNRLVTEVDDIDEVFKHVREDKGKFSMGGMASKLKAVKFAVDAGIETHIANGRISTPPHRHLRNRAKESPPNFTLPNNFPCRLKRSHHRTDPRNGQAGTRRRLRLSQLSTEEKNAILIAMAQGLRDASAEILSENEKDITAGKEKGLSSAMLDRLKPGRATPRSHRRRPRTRRHPSRSRRPSPR